MEENGFVTWLNCGELRATFSTEEKAEEFQKEYGGFRWGTQMAFLFTGEEKELYDQYENAICMSNSGVICYAKTWNHKTSCWSLI